MIDCDCDELIGEVIHKVISLPGSGCFTHWPGVARHQCARPHPREGLTPRQITVEERYEQHSYMLPREQVYNVIKWIKTWLIKSSHLPYFPAWNVLP